MPNNELISRGALLDELYNLKPHGFTTSVAGQVAIRCIADAPVVDAAPVVHGRWVNLCRDKVRMCGCCKYDFDNTCNAIDDEWKYCPNCGAKMDLHSV